MPLYMSLCFHIHFLDSLPPVNSIRCFKYVLVEQSARNIHIKESSDFIDIELKKKINLVLCKLQQTGTPRNQCCFQVSAYSSSSRDIVTSSSWDPFWLISCVDRGSYWDPLGSLFPSADAVSLQAWKPLWSSATHCLARCTCWIRMQLTWVNNLLTCRPGVEPSYPRVTQ